jgi:hypothetical protein
MAARLPLSLNDRDAVTRCGHILLCQADLVELESAGSLVAWVYRRAASVCLALAAADAEARSDRAAAAKGGA